MLLIQLAMHDFLHHHMAHIHQHLPVQIFAEESLGYACLKESATLHSLLIMAGTKQIHHAGHLVDFLIEHHPHILVSSHLILVYETDDVNHIVS